MSDDVRSEAKAFVEDRMQWADPDARSLIVDLYIAYTHFGYLPNDPVEQALDAFLVVFRDGCLRAAPARDYVDHFFGMHPDQAWFIFYKGARQAIGDERRRDLEWLIQDGLQLEHWTPAVDPILPTNKSQTVVHVPPAFTDKEFEEVMSFFFGRNRVYEESELVMLDLMRTSRAALLQKLEEAKVEPRVAESYIERFEETYEDPLREMIIRLQQGEGRGGYFWLGK